MDGFAITQYRALHTLLDTWIEELI